MQIPKATHPVIGLLMPWKSSKIAAITIALTTRRLRKLIREINRINSLKKALEQDPTRFVQQHSFDEFMETARGPYIYIMAMRISESQNTMKLPKNNSPLTKACYRYNSTLAELRRTLQGMEN